MRPLQSLLGVLLGASTLGIGSGAAAQLDRSFDLQLRKPGLGPDDSTLARGTATVPHLETAFGLDGDFTTVPVTVDTAAGTASRVVQTRGVVTLGLAMGLSDRMQLEVAMPIAYQGGDGLQGVTGTEDDRLRTGTLGDLRLMGLFRVLDPTTDAVSISAALSSWAALPTGDAQFFSSTGGFSFGASAVFAMRWKEWFAQFELGGQFRQRSFLIDEAIGNELALVGTLGRDFFRRGLSLAFGLQSLFGLAEGSGHRAIWIGEIRGRFFSDRRMQIVIGAGSGLTDTLTTPGFQAVASFRFTPSAVEASARSVGLERGALGGTR